MGAPYVVSAIKHGGSVYIVVPASIRKALDIQRGTQLLVCLSDREIRVRKAVVMTEEDAARSGIQNRTDKQWFR